MGTTHVFVTSNKPQSKRQLSFEIDDDEIENMTDDKLEDLVVSMFDLIDRHFEVEK